MQTFNFFSVRFENIVRKALSPVLMCLDSFSLELVILYQSILWTLKKPSENIVLKEENAGNQHFLLFPLCFLLYQG